ncbi:MAG: ABC transporter substrate-binding protein [Alphaproteobacteria bacterium]
MTKTGFAQLLAAAVAGALLAAAPLAATAQTVLRLDESPAGELDPAKATDYADSILMFNVYDTLVIPNQGAPGMQPHLAESWTVDGDVYTFALRDGVTFHSGNPLTAADVVYSYERMMALGQGLSYLFADRVASVVAGDDHSVVITLSGPYGPFLPTLVRLPIVDSALVQANATPDDAWAEAFLSGSDAGSGAYTVSAHNPEGETVMEKFGGYFLGVPDAAPDQVRLRYGLEAATVRTLIARGEHDISSQWLPPEVMKALADEGAQLLTESGTGGFYMKMNTTKPPLDDVHCRLALTHAIDYDTMMRMTQVTDTVAQGAPANGAIPVGMLGSDPDAPALARDMDAARAELAQCQYDPADYTLELSWIAEVPLEERFALLAQANFSELGFQSEIVRMPWVLFTEAVTDPAQTPHFSQLFNAAMTGDPDTLFYGMYHSSATGTWQSASYLDDPEVDAALEAGRTASDTAARGEAYAALNARLMALAPTITGYDRVSVFAASNRVRVPALSDPAKAFNLDGFGFTFRLMEMTGE